jgi:pimeloyl-ACP methyl ester carboxylesterase
MFDRLSRREFFATAAAIFGGSVTSTLRAQPLEPHVLDVQTPSGRICRTWRYDPKRRKRGTILFLHGAFSAPWKYEALFAHWLASGYTVFAPLHVDSTEHPGAATFKGLSGWAARIEDMRAVAATIEDRHYVAAGHSYGALAALSLGGATPLLPEGVVGPLRDARVPVILAFSPPGIMPPLVDVTTYEGVAVPALIQTGTADIPSGATGWEGHLLAWETPLAHRDRYALILDGVDHYFGGAICRPELTGPKQLKPLAMAASRSLMVLDAHFHRRQKAMHALTVSLADSGPARFIHR